MNKYLITPTLLNSWKYALDNGNIEGFLKVLNKEPIEENESIKKGYAFEDYMIKNYEPTKNGCYQVKVYKTVGNYFLYGRVDCLKAGIITDFKYTSSYDVGKFVNNYQTPIYLELIPEALEIEYVISNNFSEDKEDFNIYKETYRREEVKIDIMQVIDQFMEWLKINNLLKTYQEKWESKY